jgi:hypothetical protein
MGELPAEENWKVSSSPVQRQIQGIGSGQMLNKGHSLPVQEQALLELVQRAGVSV